MFTVDVRASISAVGFIMFDSSSAQLLFKIVSKRTVIICDCELLARAGGLRLKTCSTVSSLAAASLLATRWPRNSSAGDVTGIVLCPFVLNQCD